VRLVDQILRHGAINTRDAYRQRDLDTKARRQWADADIAGDGGVGGQRDLGLAGDKLEGAEEAGAVARSEQLLGVGTGQAIATKLLRGRLALPATNLRAPRKQAL